MQKLKLLCMLLLSECDPPCANGTCSTVIGVCQCDDGFIGTACDTGKDNTAVNTWWCYNIGHYFCMPIADM